MVTVAKVEVPMERIEIPGTWEDYLQLLRDEPESGQRVAYSDGIIEIKLPTREHEVLAALLGALVQLYCDELDIEYFYFRSTTQKAELAEKGVGPDDSFSFEEDDKLPHLAIEVVHSHGSIKKLDIYRELGIKEVWFAYTSKPDIEAHVLQEGKYTALRTSVVLPRLKLEMIEEAMKEPTPRAAKKRLRQLLTT